MIVRAFIINQLSERRKRLHDLLLTLINKDSEFEFIEEDSSDLTSSYSEKDTLNLSRVIEKNRKIIKRYQACLLYTSPSPRDKRQSRMPSSA